MLEKGKLSAFQMGLFMYALILGTSSLSIPAISAQYAKNDFWICPAVASVLGFINIFTAARLHELYPGMTVIQYAERIIGRIPGIIFGVLFFLYLTHTAGAVARLYAEFVAGNFLYKTPLLFVICSMLLLAAFAVRGGVEVLARSGILFTPVFVLPLFVLLLLIPVLDAKNVLPVLGTGIIPVLRGAAAPEAWFGEYFLIAFFLPYLTDPKKGRKWGMLSLCAVVLSFMYIDLILLFLFGPDAGNKIFPLLVAFRYIRAVNFLENMDFIMLGMWVIGSFVKIGGFYYMATLSLGQIFRLSDRRPIVFPTGLLIAMFSLWGLPSFPALASWHRYIVPFETPAILTIIPLILLLIAAFRKNKTPLEGEPAR